jgi:hypothetical protein
MLMTIIGDYGEDDDDWQYMVLWQLNGMRFLLSREQIYLFCCP